MRVPLLLFAAVAAVAILFVWSRSTPRESVPVGPPLVEGAAPRSVILLVADGMGPQQMGLLFDWARSAGQEPTALEKLSWQGTTGLLRTPAADSFLTDSAAAATALATGVATNNGMVGLDPKGRRLVTALEEARDQGKRTGLVSSTRVTHATPACFATHVAKRGNETEIARQLIEESGVDLILGGGARFFLGAADAPRLDEEIHARGYRLLRNVQELQQLGPADGRVLGLFHDDHLPYLIDRDGPGEERAPSLQQMTRKALEYLSAGEAGFFLMVEGGRIDHGGHMNDVAAVLGEMREFDQVVATAMEFQREHPETLLLVTADHETGGLCVTRSLTNPLPEHFLAMARAEQSFDKVPDEDPGAVYDKSVYGVGRYRFYKPAYWRKESRALTRSAGWNASFGSGQHSTTPVPVLAMGPGMENFTGIQTNTVVGQHLVRWMRGEKEQQ